MNWLFGQAQAVWHFLPFPGHVSFPHPVGQIFIHMKMFTLVFNFCDMHILDAYHKDYEIHDSSFGFDWFGA